VKWHEEFRRGSREGVPEFSLSGIRSRGWREWRRRSRKLRQEWRVEMASGKYGRGSSRSGVLHK